MSDLSDEASDQEAWFREQGIRQARASLGAAGEWDRLSAKWCKGAVCGDRIPDERRRAIPGVEFCVTCQEMLEQRTRRTS